MHFPHEGLHLNTLCRRTSVFTKSLHRYGAVLADCCSEHTPAIRFIPGGGRVGPVWDLRDNAGFLKRVSLAIAVSIVLAILEG
jgi:hypothetical protein